MRTCVIFNPTARGDKARRFRRHLDDIGAQSTLKLTTAVGDAGQDFGSYGGQLAAQLPASVQKILKDNDFTVRARRVAIDDEKGGCFRLVVVSIYEVDEPDLSHMLRSFEPRAADSVAAGTPR